MGFRRVLVANRGEIAARVLRTANRLGYETVALFSDADSDAPYLRLADRAVRLGRSEAAESYLSIERVLAAARASGADAIHPGYGFLSENADFARACAEAGITFIGPPAAAMDLMGNKSRARAAMTKAGVPCVPGYHGDDQSDAAFARESERIGLPVMIKAAAGGGGRGMRIVESADQLADALRSARSESENAFGSTELILEKALIQPRHVEIQVFADSLGAVIHLGERDCSVQRRFQKVVEESPSPAVGPELRRKMGQTAVAAARACGYVNAGTVEFLLDRDGSFYFLEMNTRLQVEHPVTELVTGLDLVEWQLHVAGGGALPLTQQQVELNGHAIEARIYAEDPARDFMPDTGKLLCWELPDTPGIRVDSGVEQGSVVSPYYDAMLAKVVAHGADRGQARQRLLRALRETTILGLQTNRDLLLRIGEHPAFASGDLSTGFLSESEGFNLDPEPPGQRMLICAAFLFLADSATRASGVVDDSWIGWCNTSGVHSTLRFVWQDQPCLATIARDMNAPRSAQRFLVSTRIAAADEKTGTEAAPAVGVELVSLDPDRLCLEFAGLRYMVRYARDGETLYLQGDETRTFRNTANDAPTSRDAAGSGLLKAPLAGVITGLFVEVGDLVSSGQLLLVMEAMKMEHQLKADVDGLVAQVVGRVGTQVRTKQLLVQIEASKESQEG